MDTLDRYSTDRKRSSPVTADLLMCLPRHYGIDYEINPWMDRRRQVDRRRAIAQWRNLYRALTGRGEEGVPRAGCRVPRPDKAGRLAPSSHGTRHTAPGTPSPTRPIAEVELLAPQRGLPDLVFTANAGLVYGDRFVPSRFRHVERAGEEPIFRAWFAEHGFELVDLPEGCAFEGAGDALFCGENLFAGYHYRSDIRSHRMLSERLGVPVLSLELVDPRFYHLDTCFCPLDRESAIYYPGAFDDYGRRVLQERIPHLIGINDEDAALFGANAVVLGRDVFMNAGCDTLYRQLEERGFQPHAVELGEFLKSGGSAKCLTLDLQAPR
jgi:N-dimethylarginine dimethylaminohydrolase